MKLFQLNGYLISTVGTDGLVVQLWRTHPSIVNCLGVRHLIHVIILSPEQNGRQFAYAFFLCNFLNENEFILILFSLKFVFHGPVDDEPLAEPMFWDHNMELLGYNQLWCDFCHSVAIHISHMFQVGIDYIRPMQYKQNKLKVYHKIIKWH